jgi:hypothetical protein
MRTTRRSKSSIQMLYAARRAAILPNIGREYAGTQMGSIVTALQTMGTGQIFLASVFLGCYALALGEFAGPRGRLVAILTAVFVAVAFVALSKPWEAGVILLALAPLGMGLFAGAAWALCKLTAGASRPAAVVGSAPLRSTNARAASASLLERLRARLRFA